MVILCHTRGTPQCSSVQFYLRWEATLLLLRPLLIIVLQKLEEQFIKSNKQVKEIGILSFEVAGTILIYLFITSYQIYQNFEGEFETKDSARKCERMISN